MSRCGNDFSFRARPIGSTLSQACFAKNEEAGRTRMFTNFVIHFVVGLIGGNATCESAPRFSLGPLGNTLAGGLGGIGGAQLFAILVPIDMTLASADIQLMVGQLAAAGLCGTALTCLLGYLRNSIWKNRHNSHHLHHHI
jgi:hypothetical protein